MMKEIILVLLIGIPVIFACEGVWDCVRTDVASNLTSILQSDTWDLTEDGRFIAERIRDSNGPVIKVSPDASISKLIKDSIRVFDTHQLLWRVIPGVVDVKIFKHDGEGMDFGVDMPGSADPDGRTWQVAGMRRRITMALLPIMYKLGVGTTLLGVLVFLGIKTAAMVSVLFVLALGSLAKHKLGVLSNSNNHNGQWSAPPPQTHAAPIQKEVHVHVHTDPHKQPDHSWFRKPPSPHDDYEHIGPLSAADPYSGYGSSYDEPQLLYRTPYRRWQTAWPSNVRPASPWSSHAQLTRTLPASAYAMNPRWTWQRYMEQEYPPELTKTLDPEKIKRSQ